LGISGGYLEESAPQALTSILPDLSTFFRKIGCALSLCSHLDTAPLVKVVASPHVEIWLRLKIDGE